MSTLQCCCDNEMRYTLRKFLTQFLAETLLNGCFVPGAKPGAGKMKMKTASLLWELLSRGATESMCDGVHGTMKCRVGAQQTRNLNFYDSFQFTKHSHEHYSI